MLLRELRWVADAKAVVRSFPKGARLKIGQELTRLQLGANPKHCKALAEIGRGVQEIRVADNKEAFRVIYVVSIGPRVVVLHAFHKKSKQGIATPRGELELAQRRFRMLTGSHGE
jgi:phage-related protein